MDSNRYRIIGSSCLLEISGRIELESMIENGAAFKFVGEEQQAVIEIKDWRHDRKIANIIVTEEGAQIEAPTGMSMSFDGTLRLRVNEIVFSIRISSTGISVKTFVEGLKLYRKFFSKEDELIGVMTPWPEERKHGDA